MADETATYSDEQLRPFLGYIGEVRDSLRMQNWDIILHLTQCEDEDTHAHTWQEHNHTTLNIELGPKLFEETPHRIRNTIVHELVHAQHRDVTRLWDDCTKNNDVISEADANSWDGDFHVFMERFVSWITQRITEGNIVPDYVPSKKYRDHVGCYMLGEHSA